MIPGDPNQPPAGAKADGRKLILFGLLCIVVITGVVAFAIHDQYQRRQRAASTAPPGAAGTNLLTDLRRQPGLMFRNTALGPAYGQLALARLDAPDGLRLPTGLPCERVYGNGRSGLCLQSVREAFPIFQAVSFNANFQVVHIFKLAGEPSRTRVSPDGRIAAATVFIAGHGYSGVGFSTRTAIFDIVTGKPLTDDLENFSVTKDGQPFHNADFNFWGVTFAGDGDHFYATLASGGINYLGVGSLANRQLRVLRPGVECPSLSPDGVQIAFKSRVTNAAGPHWQLHVWNLKTGTETTVNESRSVDDQVEWLDADHVLYGLPRNLAGSATWDIWMARVDGTGIPSLFVHDAASPCVVRNAMVASAEDLSATSVETSPAAPPAPAGSAETVTVTPLLSLNQSYRLRGDGMAVAIDLATGALTNATAVNLVVQCWTEKLGKKSGQRFNWHCRLTLPGGGLLVTDEKIPALAPNNGYAPALEITRIADQTAWQNEVALPLYYHLTDGRYGWMNFSVSVGALNYCVIDSRLNPTGSQDLTPAAADQPNSPPPAGTMRDIPSFK
jgi:hypothetical protein